MSGPNPALKRRLGGKIAKIEGDRFEAILVPWAHAIRATLTRIPNGCKTIRRGPKLMIIRVKSPFDFILTRYNSDLSQAEVAFFDAKSISTGTFAHSLINQDQLIELDKIAKNGFSAGYLVHFRKHSKVVFFDVNRLKVVCKGEGLGIDQGMVLGNLENLCLGSIF